VLGLTGKRGFFPHIYNNATGLKGKEEGVEQGLKLGRENVWGAGKWERVGGGDGEGKMDGEWVALGGGIQILLPRESCKGAETDSRAKFGKETVCGAHRRPKWVPHYGVQANLRLGQDAQALLRLCSGMLTLGSG
jgi:hypothetical protein